MCIRDSSDAGPIPGDDDAFAHRPVRFHRVAMFSHAETLGNSPRGATHPKACLGTSTTPNELGKTTFRSVPPTAPQGLIADYANQSRRRECCADDAR